MRTINAIGRTNLASYGFLIVTASMFSILTYGGKYHQLLELTSRFRLQYCVAGAIGVLLFRYYSKRALCFLSLFCFLLNLCEILPWYYSRQPSFLRYSEISPPAMTIDDHATSSQSETFPAKLRVMIVNVHTANAHFGEVINDIQKEDPDILALLEIDSRWERELKALNDTLPFSFSAPREDNFGIVLFSKHPLHNPTVEYLAKVPVPTLVAQITAFDHSFTVIASHTLPPASSEYYRARNEQLQALGEYVMTHSSQPVILLGDLNTSLWSPYYVELEQRSKLRNVRRGQGIFPTWPAQLPILYTPIDHILVSREFTIHSTHSGHVTGSDHRSLVTELLLGAPACP